LAGGEKKSKKKDRIFGGGLFRVSNDVVSVRNKTNLKDKVIQK
jgi:hypothetical protein